MIAALAVVLLLLALPGTIELLLVTVGGLLPARAPRAGARLAGRLAVVVPAHDEAEGIAACVASLRNAAVTLPGAEIVVVADNCSDDTAARAHAAGARVLERVDPDRRGKGYALSFAFDVLLAEGVAALIVVDADSLVTPDTLVELSAWLADGADAAQARYGVANPEAGLRPRLMGVALMAFNVLRPRGRARWGLSAGILGNGFALTAATLRAVPYDAHSVVEDLEYHLRLVRSGRRVAFADRATVLASMPTGGRGVRTQRARWEGGRLRMVREAGPGLLAAVATGSWRLLEPLLELLLLPLASHVLVLALALALPWGPGRVCALVGLIVVAVHVLAGIAVGGGGWRDLAALAAAPFYVAWKLALMPAIARASRRDTDWVRTERPAGGRT